MEILLHNRSHRRQVLEFKKKHGASITKPFFNYCPSSEYLSETYIAYNAEHYERIRNILPIVYSINYDPKGVSRSSQPQNPKLGAYDKSHIEIYQIWT